MFAEKHEGSTQSHWIIHGAGSQPHAEIFATTLRRSLKCGALASAGERWIAERSLPVKTKSAVRGRRFWSFRDTQLNEGTGERALKTAMLSQFRTLGSTRTKAAKRCEHF